jgi:prepilin-type N-terminal cleavage/methylation domain-containing protein
MYLALTSRCRRARARAHDERGFSLIELLVSLVAGLVVSGAAMALVITSLHLTSNYSDRVDANQQGRLAMDRITQALNSSCISPSVIPVLAGSTATALSFYSSQGVTATAPDAPLINPTLITVTMNGTSTTPGSFVMTTQQLSGTTNNWTNSGTAASFTLLPWAMPSAATPTVFQYYGYASDTTPTSLITPGANGLTAAQAAKVVLVTINFQALPSDNWSAGNRPANFSSSVALRLTPASSASSASNSPCA